jgi:SAM-dependent methyltransferase
MAHEPDAVVYERTGFCPICASATMFRAFNGWYRDHLLCEACGAIPRERALALVLEREWPNWRNLAVHESSPGYRRISPKLARECRCYLPTQFFPGAEPGRLVKSVRNENLESQSFEAEVFDLVVTLDVMEHVNRPERAFREIARTLRSGGAYLFTVPTYKGKVVSERRALYQQDGTPEFLAEPEYHGNPVSDAGSLVTFHYGYDLPDRIHEWCGMDVEVRRFHDHEHGIIGEFTEVYVARKRGR